IDDMKRNVVVTLDYPRCSGVLITPLLVLTAKHCALGDTAQPSYDVQPTIGVGHDKDTATATSNASKTILYGNFVYGARSPTPADATARATKEIDRKGNPPLERAIITRPSFNAPAPVATFFGNYYTTQLAGWSNYSGNGARQVIGAPTLTRGFGFWDYTTST